MVSDQTGFAQITQRRQIWRIPSTRTSGAGDFPRRPVRTSSSPSGAVPASAAEIEGSRPLGGKAEARRPPPIARLTVEVGHPLGLHLRPAARFAETARRFAAEVRVRCHGAEADGKSVMDLLCLVAVTGTSLILEASGPDAAEAVEALADVVADPHRGSVAGTIA